MSPSSFGPFLVSADTSHSGRLRVRNPRGSKTCTSLFLRSRMEICHKAIRVIFGHSIKVFRASEPCGRRRARPCLSCRVNTGPLAFRESNRAGTSSTHQRGLSRTKRKEVAGQAPLSGSERPRAHATVRRGASSAPRGDRTPRRPEDDHTTPPSSRKLPGTERRGLPSAQHPDPPDAHLLPFEPPQNPLSRPRGAERYRLDKPRVVARTYPGP